MRHQRMDQEQEHKCPDSPGVENLRQLIVEERPSLGEVIGQIVPLM